MQGRQSDAAQPGPDEVRRRDAHVEEQEAGEGGTDHAGQRGRTLLETECCAASAGGRLRR